MRNATSDNMWIFGYGSLVWRPAFPYTQCQPGFVRGYSRKFWQASADHRGTPAYPGRVATLIEEPGAVCWGMAYRVDAARTAEVLEILDNRETGGYRRLSVDISLMPAGAANAGSGGVSGVTSGAASAAASAVASNAMPAVTVEGLIYIAEADNANYLGPMSDEEIAFVVRRAQGLSGANREYVLRLHQALVDIGTYDPHVAALVRLLGD